MVQSLVVGSWCILAGHLSTYVEGFVVVLSAAVAVAVGRM